MDVFLGRGKHLEALTQAEHVARGGGVALLSVLGEAGSGRTRLLDEFERHLEQDGIPVRRTAAFKATETEPGSIGEALDLGGELEGALLIDDAQWADATSLALLRAGMARASSGLIIVLAHSEVFGYRRFAYANLMEAANRLGRSWELTLDRLDLGDVEALFGGSDADRLATQLISSSGGLAGNVVETLEAWEAAGAVRWEGGTLVATGTPIPAEIGVPERVARLEGPERRLAELLAVARRPVTIAVAAAALLLPEDDVLDIGERLVAAGLATESAEGFLPGRDRLREYLGPVRTAALYGTLADAGLRVGIAERNPGLVGGYYLDAARWGDALPLLARAGLERADRQHLAEAYPLLDGALRAYEASGAEDPELEGRLRLARATCYRLAGWSELAAEDLTVAADRLSGVDRVHALGYAGQVADDRQLPQEAERLLAGGLLEAVIAGELGMLGSLLTLHARTLARLGFAQEADAELDKGLEILSSHGTAQQQQRGRYNEAWVAFDRGRARDAETGFARLVDEARGAGGPALMADREAWWSRALFMAGRPDQALAARRRSIEHADVSAGPVFLAHMALAEGAIRFGVWDTALEAADETLALVLQQLPAWENSARYLRARALFGAGRTTEAKVEAQLALDSCPEGVNGRRWRLRIRVVQLAIGVANGDAWNADEAFDLTDELLQSEWYLTSARLLIVRSKADQDPTLAAEAMALADQLGVAGVAAEAAEAGRLWNTPGAAAVVASVKARAGHIPEDWREAWEALPEIATALAAPEVGDEAYHQASERLSMELEQALQDAGLGVEGRLVSPAQRRARGLKRRKRPFRWTPIRVAAAVVAVTAIGLGGGFLARVVNPPPTTTTTAPVVIAPTTTTTTRPPEIWETELGPPSKNTVVGQWTFAGDLDDQEQFAHNTGASKRTGVRSADGYYWKYTAGGRIESSPAVFGESVIFGSEDGSLYGIAMPSGVPPLWIEDSAGDGILGPPTLAFLTSESGLDPTSGMRIYYGSKDGVLRIRSDARKRTAQVWQFPAERVADGEIVSAPLVLGDTVYFGTNRGVLYAVDTADPFDERWHIDLASPIRAASAAADGILYVPTEGGILWAVDSLTGEARECFDTGDTIVSPPVIAGDTVFIPARDAQNLYAVQVGSCNPEAGILLSITVTSPPAYADGVLYIANDNFIQAWDAVSRRQLWQFPSTDTVSPLEGRVGWPVVGDGVLYFTTDEPYLYAVDLETHQELWRYLLDGRVVSRPAILDGAVIVGDLSGTIVAIGCSDPPECG
ncbi:MAG TPA: hypothetical protein ENH00_06855 [Actinobacteria bacterium]|nr:outer membrane biogenesis protein BamB [bacterium BMS3Bbin01]HDH25894.1 hypothetical protein [Actinomycetota bacterium]